VFEAGLLKEETVLVTGGGSGLGFALCEKLVALGARVHICGRRRGMLDEAVARLSSTGGDGVFAHTVDIRDPAAVDAMCEAIFADRPLTGLVNNAAANFLSPTERLSPRGFDAIASTVFHGTFYLTHAVGRRWIDAGVGGSVVSIVSTGVANGAPFVVPSTMSKAAICAMTKSLAIEWGRHGIRLNAIGPGLIPTEGAVARLMPGNSTEQLRAANPMKRLGTVDELQNLAVFMLARGCGWMTGQVVMLDGAHHQAHGSVYTPLLDLSGEEWTAITASIRAQDAADKARRAAGESTR
jgi:NAD(P)-dependent dehydrogenase (short-subunit alcohol dehydrogenase family)